MKLEKAKKKLQNMFQSNLNEISRGRYKPKDQKSALENIKLLYKSQEVAIKLFTYYCSIASEAEHKAKYGQGMKYKKFHTKTINLKYQLQRGMKNLSCLTDHSL